MCFFRPTYQERNWGPQQEPTEEEIVEAHRYVKSLPPATPESILKAALPRSVDLGFLRDARLRVVEPIHVLITVEEGLVVAEAEGLGEFGSGANISDAITDIQHTLSDLYFVLDEEKDRLGPGLQETWDRLQLMVEPR